LIYLCETIMHIIFGHENTPELRQKYTVLTLDTFLFAGQADPVTAYCVIESVPLEEIHKLDMWQDLHENLIKQYRTKNWKYCEDALEHLKGRWQGELDSFYADLWSRISEYKNQDPGLEWSGIRDKTVIDS